MGTASFVTDETSESTQFFLNLPSGEIMYEQQSGVYDNPYKFNAKELDEDIGLYYYGARYYNPRLSIWYGVDPLAAKYPSWSPYNYTFDNPIIYTDPTGMGPEDWIRKDGVWQYDATVTTAEQAYKMEGVTGFAKNGTVISDAKIGLNGEAGYVRLNEGGRPTYEPMYGLINTITSYIQGYISTWDPQEFPQITNPGGAARTDFDQSTWDKFRPGDKLYTLDMGSFVQPGSLPDSPGSLELFDRFSAFLDGMKNLSDAGRNIFKSQPDTLHIKATFVYPEKGVLFKDTIFSEPYRKKRIF